jgi:hypothetical protein
VRFSCCDVVAHSGLRIVTTLVLWMQRTGRLSYRKAFAVEQHEPGGTERISERTRRRSTGVCTLQSARPQADGDDEFCSCIANLDERGTARMFGMLHART